MPRTLEDQALIDAIGEQIKNAPPCSKKGDILTVEMIAASLRYLLVDMPVRLAKIRRAMEVANG